MRSLMAGLALMLTVSWQSAHAQFALGFDDPNTQGVDLTIEDNGPYDLNEILGVIEFCAENGPLLTCTRGASKPAEGSATLPVLILKINFLRYTAGPLNIMLTDTDFIIGASTAVTEIKGGIEGGDSVSYKIFADSGNRPFHRGTEINSFGPFISPDSAIDGEADSPAPGVGSLTLSIEYGGSEGIGDEINTSGFIALQLIPLVSDVSVPDVVGLGQLEAEAAIESAGLNVGSVKTLPNSSVAAGAVISQDPSGGSSVPPGSSVNLVVSAGGALSDVPNQAGLAGVWFDPAFDGEGYVVVVTSSGMFLYYYGHDKDGERLWLLSETATAPIQFGQSIELTLFQASGTFADPSPDLEEWGTLVIIFDSCTEGRAQLIGADGNKVANILKLTAIGGLDCGS